MDRQYPKWIDEYTKAIHQAFSNMLPCGWGPINVIEVVSCLNGSLVAKVYEAIVKLKGKGVQAAEVAQTFSNPSTFRTAIWYLSQDYAGADPKPKQQAREVLDFLVEALQSWVKEDLFAMEKNVAHSQEEIDQILEETKWQGGNPKDARELGKLYNSVASLAFALYRDFFPQEAHEIYGPYDVSSMFGDNTILVMKHFPKIKPTELWPQVADFQYEDVKILQVFRNVKFQCEVIGMHSIYEGDLMNGLVKYAVVANGKPIAELEDIKELNHHFEQLATEQSQMYDDMSHDELVNKALEWLCYQFVNMFKLAKMDWRPTEQMQRAVKGKKISHRHEEEEFPSYDEFVSSKEFEVYWLRKLYGNKQR